jgi:mono/diheme cytochrome c family protein
VTTIAQVTARRASRSISSRPTSGDAALDHVFMNRPTRLFIGAFAFAGALGLAGLLAFAWTGVSARNAPSAFEAWAARSARHLLIPASARAAATPLAASPELLERAKDHFADHCALCHGYDGHGDTPIGRGLHPRVPDLTLAATQDLPDGELFWIIEHGVKLTGMPAFGEESPDDDDHAWQLVLWIRRLPALTPEEIEAIEREHGPAAQAHHHER